MAKITTYPIDTNVTDGDKLIGTDVDNLDATKNFTIGGIVSHLATNHFVPYTGATQTVSLGSEWITTTGKGSFGLLDVNGNSAFSGATNTFVGQVNAGFVKADFGIQLPNGGFAVGITNDEGGTGEVLISQGSNTAPVWGTLPYIEPIMASYYSDIDQLDLAIGVADGPNFMIFNQTYFSNPDISVDLNPVALSPTFGLPTRLTFNKIGKFKIDFTAQIVKSSGGGTQKASIWFRKNTGNIANSNRHTIPLSTGEYFLAAWNFIVDITSVGDFIEICWQGANLKLEYEVPTSGPLPLPHPATPSTTVIITRVA